MLMVTWRNDMVDTARPRQTKRDKQEWKFVMAHRRVECCEATPIDLVDVSKESLHGRETDRDLRSA